ncbi:MAG: hypothetical protein KDI09_18145 [Halioglobus sp.]|nr:hypothetical protein [Halioglobus sp.]
MTTTPSTDTERRRLLSLLLATPAVSLTSAVARADNAVDKPGNPLLWALAWQQTAAEYRALCYQAYNLARLRLDLALATRSAGERPLAVITDIDSTVLHADSYWGYLVNEGMDFFDDAIWDEWLPENLMTVVPDSLEFLRYCKEQDVEVFYVTNRDQGEKTRDYALIQLQELGFPYVDSNHLYTFRETSDKTSARDAIKQSFDIALMLGDNLNDFRRNYYVTDIDERLALTDRDRADWGNKFIVLPNATDGHWLRPIFGESEPPPNDRNRELLKQAATRSAWAGPPR